MQDVDLSTLDPRVLINHVVFRVFPDFFSGEQGFGPWVPKRGAGPKGGSSSGSGSDSSSLGQALLQKALQVGALSQRPARLDQLSRLGLADHGVAQIVELFLKQAVAHGVFQ